MRPVLEFSHNRFPPLSKKSSKMKFVFSVILLTFLLSSPVHSQNDWHFVDESASRLPDTCSLSVALAGGPLRPGGNIDLLIGQFPDIIRNLPGVAQLFLNNGQGYFELVDSSAFPQRDDDTSTLMLFDIDGDGDLDALIVNSNYLTDFIAMNNGNGIFNIDWERLPIDTAVALEGNYADIDGDGSIDVCLLGNNEVRFSNRMWMNNGQGYFHNEIDRLPALRPFYLYITFADLNGDLAPDIIAVYYDSPSNICHLQVFINNGSGYYIDESQNRLPPTEPFIIGALPIDIDNDGDFDLVLSYLSKLGYFINDGQGYFTDETNERGPLFPEVQTAPDIKPLDADIDGDEDLIIGTGGDSNLVFINNGHGYYEDQTVMRWPNQSNYTTRLFVGDFDGDGDGDIFRVGTYSCRNSIYINTLNVRDSIPPSIKNQTILPEYDTLAGSYPVKMVAQDGVSIEYQLSCHVHYSTDRINFYSDSLHYTGGFIFYGTIPEMDSGTTVYYYYTAADKEGNESRMPRNAPDSVFSFTYMPGYEGIDEGSNTFPVKLAISAYPNPFNSNIKINISNPKGGDCSVRIFDIAGRLIRNFGQLGANNTGQATLLWDGNSESGGSVPSGVYFIDVVVGQQRKDIRILLIK
jgi:hypothetical protein